MEEWENGMEHAMEEWENGMEDENRRMRMDQRQAIVNGNDMTSHCEWE
jgi:hypothetical protein